MSGSKEAEKFQSPNVSRSSRAFQQAQVLPGRDEPIPLPPALPLPAEAANPFCRRDQNSTADAVLCWDVYDKLSILCSLAYRNGDATVDEIAPK